MSNARIRLTKIPQFVEKFFSRRLTQQPSVPFAYELQIVHLVLCNGHVLTSQRNQWHARKRCGPQRRGMDMEIVGRSRNVIVSLSIHTIAKKHPHFFNPTARSNINVPSTTGEKSCYMSADDDGRGSPLEMYFDRIRLQTTSTISR
jgi:hypothetical protein